MTKKYVEDKHVVGNIHFDLQLVSVLQVEERSDNPSTYNAIRYMRHTHFKKLETREK